MRIAVIASSYPRFEGDGTAPFVKSISESLYKIGNEVEVVAPYDPLVVENTPSLVKVHRFKYALGKNLHIMGHAKALDSDIKLKKSVYLLLPFFILFSFIKLLQVTKNQKSHIIHAHWVIPNGLTALIVSKIRKIPLVISLHGSDIFIAKSKWYFRIVAKMIFKNTSFISACSENLLLNAKDLGAPENIKLIAWGADPEKFFKINNYKNPKFNFRDNENQTILLCLGRLVHKKGFSNLIKAMPMILEKNNNIKLVIGGDGPLKKDLEDLSKTCGVENSVIFIGEVKWNEVVLFLNCGDIFIQPSIKDEYGNMDGLPTVILEAMACGLPIIASDIGGISLVVKDCLNGKLVIPDDVDDLSRTINSLILESEKLKLMGENSRKLVEDQLNWVNVSKIFEQNFEMILNFHSIK
jgi:glycosyltransferase involved in cell wall biosynthesis